MGLSPGYGTPHLYNTFPGIFIHKLQFRYKSAIFLRTKYFQQFVHLFRFRFGLLASLDEWIFGSCFAQLSINS